MTLKHPSDTDIQQYAQGLEPGLDDHMQACAACSAKAEMYRNMIAAIREQPAPGLGFDVSALVMARIRPAHRIAVPVLYPALAAILLMAAGGVYLFRNDIAAVFSGALAMLTWLTVTTLITIFIFQGIDLFKAHRKKLREFLQH